MGLFGESGFFGGNTEILFFILVFLLLFFNDSNFGVRELPAEQ
jgi:hypothetical protein